MLARRKQAGQRSKADVGENAIRTAATDARTNRSPRGRGQFDINYDAMDLNVGATRAACD